MADDPKIPLHGDRLRTARLEVSMLSNDALTYVLGVALVALNDQVDEKAAPETKAKLLTLVECLQGASDNVPPHISATAIRGTQQLLDGFLAHFPDRERPKWAN